MEWVKITDVDSMPRGVPLWLFNKMPVRLTVANDILDFGTDVAKFYSHYKHVQAPPSPAEKD